MAIGIVCREKNNRFAHLVRAGKASRIQKQYKPVEQALKDAGLDNV